MAKQEKKLEFRYYNIPAGEYVLPKLGDGWVQQYGVGYEDTMHFHNYMEIGYFYYGKGELLIEDRTYQYSGDDPMFSVIPANIPHNTITVPGRVDHWEFLFIDIDSFIREEMKGDRFDVDEVIRIVNKRGTLKTKANHPALDRIIQSIIGDYRKEGLYYKESVKGYLKAFVIELLRLDEERGRVQRSSAHTAYLSAAITYIEEHYAEDFRVSDLANVCGLSESHFRRVFEDSMNMKPADFVNLIRIQHGCRLIENEHLSMEEVGYRVGYTTPSTFNRNFKRITGKTPYQWKSEAKKRTSTLAELNISALKGWEALDTGYGFTE